MQNQMLEEHRDLEKKGEKSLEQTRMKKELIDA